LSLSQNTFNESLQHAVTGVQRSMQNAQDGQHVPVAEMCDTDLTPQRATNTHAGEDTEIRSIRVTLVHPSLPKYRVPVFQELARRPGMVVRVVYGAAKGIPNVEAEGFEAVKVPRWEGTVGGKLIMFQGAEWSYCSPRVSDVVVMRWTPRSVTLLPALLRARASGVGTVLWGHGYSKQEKRWWMGIRNWLSRRADALLFYDPETRNRFVRAGWNPSCLFVALNSLDNTEIDRARRHWSERSDDLSKFRQRQGIDKGPVILFVSRLQPANRVDLLIRATVQLAPVFPGLKTVIIGSGDEEKHRLQALVHQLRAEGSVVFVDGVYDEMSLAPWFLAADVFCYPANVGLSLLHAFWYGLPVVTSDNLSIQNPEIVALENGVNGLTYEDGKTPALADALHRILIDRELQASMSRGARRSVEERFTVPRMVDGLAEAIRYADQSRGGH
jgi:glycosyltransferase involved in cell wall biosynthesis